MVHLTRIRIALIAGLCLVAVIAAALWAVKPAALSERTIRAKLAQDLREWTGATVTVAGPVSISYFPRLVMELGTVRLSQTTRLPGVREVSAAQVEVRLGLWSLVSGTPVVDRLTLIEPRIEARMEAVAATQASGRSEVPVLMRFLQSAPFDQIAVERGALSVTGPQASEHFKDVTAKVNMRRSNGALSSRGSFVWRDQAVTFRHEGGAAQRLANALKMPVSISIGSTLFSAEIDGTATLANGLSIAGDLDLRIASLPRFARWTGVLVPGDQNGAAFSAAGMFHWSGRRIGFDEGTFALDSNKALGALALEFGGPRPQIEGTLALQRLDLTPYLAGADRKKPAADAKARAARAQRADMDFPLLHHVNVDMRISAAELVAPPLKVGQSALSVTLNAGRLAADIAIFDLCAGSGNGRLEFDATVPDPAFRLTANLGGVAAQSCIGMFASKSPLTGTAEVTAELSGKGRTAYEVLKSLRGKAGVSMGAGQMDVDIARLAASVRNGRIDGWDGTRGNATAFQALEGDFFFRDTGIYTDSLAIDLGTSEVTAEGTIDPVERTLDLRLSERNHPPEKDSSPETGTGKPVLNLAGAIVIKGPWSGPSFSLEPVKSSADIAPEPASLEFVWRTNN